MVFTRSGKVRAREGVKGEVKMKKGRGICPDSKPKLKGKRTTRNHRKVQTETTKDQSFSLSSSSQFPFQLSPPAQGNLSLNILQYCYNRRQDTNPHVSSPISMPRRVVPESRHLENNLLDDKCAALECHEGTTTPSPKGFVASPDDNDSNQILHADLGISSPTKSMNITEMADQMDGELDDIDSFGSEVDLVNVEGYLVRPKHAEMLRAIIFKHGDIGANCCLQSNVLRSSSMEFLCENVLALKDSSILRITEEKIMHMQDFICDLERQKIEVNWLKTRLHQILGAKLAVPILKKSSCVKMLRDESKAKVKTLTEQLSMYEKDMYALQGKIDAIKQQRTHAESEARRSDLIISDSRAKLECMSRLGSLISDLL